MNKIINIPLMICVLLCLVNSVHAQWIDRGTYSELNINIPDIKYLKISSDSSSVFIQKADTLKKISLADGKIIEEKYLDSIASFGIVAVSNDDRYYTYPVVDEYKFMARVYDCNTDSLLNIIDYINYHNNKSLYGHDSYNALLYFRPDNNNLIIAGYYYLDYGYGNFETGKLSSYDPLTGQETGRIISDTGIIKTCYTSGLDYIAFRYYQSYVVYYGLRLSGWFYEKGLYLHDLKKQKKI